MLKKTKMLSASLIVVFAVMILSAMVSPAEAYVEGINWLPPYVMKGYEDFYDATIVGYEEGVTVTATILVENDYWWSHTMNVSAVIINFDWDANYSSTEVNATNPYELPYGQTHIFTVEFTAPPVSDVSNMYAHEYKIIVEHVNKTGGQLTPWIRARSDYPYLSSYKFALFSEDQTDATDLYSEYQNLKNSYPGYYGWQNAEAQMLAVQASGDAYLGNLYYTRGDFASAETQFQSAIDLYNQAITKDGAWQTTYQEAQLNVTQIQAEAALTEANAAMKEAEAAEMQAQAAINQSYAYIMFGLGWIIMGIGIVIYAAKKPTTA